MPNYIEYHDGDEPKREAIKSDGSYAEPIKSESEAETTEAKETANASERVESVFARNEGGIKQPKTIVFALTVAGLIAAFVLSKFWTREAELSRFIVQGNRISKTEDIERAVSRFIGKKMNDVSLSDIVDTLQSLPYVRKAIATKELPDAVRVRIQERAPVAIAIIGEKLRLIDDAGFIMNKSESALESARLPILTGFAKIVRDSLSAMNKLDSAETANALGFCKALMETKCAKLLISEARIANGGQIHAYVAEGDAPFIFGVGNYEERLRNFEIFWKQVVVKKGLKPFEYVDVRFDGKIFAKEHESTNPKRKIQN